jgi:hypothetical protein
VDEVVYLRHADAFASQSREGVAQVDKTEVKRRKSRLHLACPWQYLMGGRGLT